jgi:diguanylate cyclase (GGDEF)-like protein
VRVWLPAVCVLTVLIAGMGIVIARTQSQSRSALEQRYELRVALASRFVGAYVDDIHHRQVTYAREFLATRAIQPESFREATKAFGFDAAVLLDARGRVLGVVPAQRELLGQRVDQAYPHLRSALRGVPAVSNVVLSEAHALPVVAVAVPFETPFGRRVFSGGAQLDHSPLAAFLADALPYKGARAYLMDAKGFVMVSGGSHAAAVASPPDTHGRAGAISIAGTEYRFAEAPVAGTPWHLVTVTPSWQLFAPLTGWKHWVPWFILSAFALAAVAALWLLSRLMRQKAELAHLATHDPLTGALNRRTLERVFQRLSEASLRTDAAVGVLVIDLDRFKSVNDEYGHAAGDELLRRVAETLVLTLRPVDVVARIGGDEFVVLLAHVNGQELQEIAGRVFRTLNESSFHVAIGVDLAARCSVGVALATQEDVVDTVLARADGSLYRSKDQGRTLSQATAAR